VNAATVSTFEMSLERCMAQPDFLDRFYETFLGSSPKVREKFAATDFDKQKRALQASFYLMLRAAREEGSGTRPAYLDALAQRHGAGQLGIGAELYDQWLDCLLATAKACDPEYSEDVEQAWEQVMSVGIRYLCSRYNG
jgi:hemoglobin-like flavoprotein